MDLHSSFIESISYENFKSIYISIFTLCTWGLNEEHKADPERVVVVVIAEPSV